MKGLDSNKLEISIDSLRDYREDAFLCAPVRDKATGVLLSDKERLKGERSVLGLKSIEINKKLGKIVLETSAKILHEKYYDLININNIEQVVSNINQTGLIELDTNEFIETANVLRTDFTNNLRVTKDIQKYLIDLEVFAQNAKYKVEPYKTGIAISAKAKSNNERLILYDKEQELYKGKENRELMNYVKPEQFRGVLRVEGNYRKFSNIRTAFSLQSKEPIKLLRLLESKENVNYKMFDKVFDTSLPQTVEGLTLMEMTNSNRKLREINKQIADERVLELCKYDMELVRKFVKTKVKGNISSYIRHYTKVLARMKNRKLKNDFSSIEEIKKLLKEVA